MSGTPGVAGRPRWLKVLAGLALAIGLLNAGVFVYGLTLPNEWRVEGSVIVAAEPEEIYPLVMASKRWPEWSPWSRDRDPSATIGFEGPDSGQGSVLSFDGERLGFGRLEITSAVPNESIGYRLRLGGAEFSDGGRIRLEAVKGGTQVTWADGGKLGGTLGRLFGDRLEAAVAADFAAALGRLKSLAEGRAAPSADAAG